MKRLFFTKGKIKDLPLAEHKKSGNFKDNEHSWHFFSSAEETPVQKTNRMESLSHPQTPSIRSHSPNSWSIWSKSSSPRFSQHYGKIRHCTPSTGRKKFYLTSVDGVGSQTQKLTREQLVHTFVSHGFTCCFTFDSSLTAPSNIFWVFFYSTKSSYANYPKLTNRMSLECSKICQMEVISSEFQDHSIPKTKTFIWNKGSNHSVFRAGNLLDFQF